MRFLRWLGKWIGRRREPPEDEETPALKLGQSIEPEEMARHPISIAFPRAAIDTATYARLGDRTYWHALLAEDLSAGMRDDEQLKLDDFSLDMLNSDAIVSVIGPEPTTPPPADLLYYTAVGFNESLLELAERCDHYLIFAVHELNQAPVRLGWPLAFHLARIAARETGGLICDYWSERWWCHERWSEINPYPGCGKMMDWVAIHNVYETHGPTHMHTHGMMHFGMPDLEICDVSRFQAQIAEQLLLATCYVLIRQSFSPDTRVSCGGELEIAARDVWLSKGIRDEADRADLQRYRTRVRLVPGDAKSALVENRLLRVIPGTEFGTGPDAFTHCVNALFPHVNVVTRPNNLDDMEAGHLEAVEKLPDERRRFQRGLRPGERFAVKVPFAVAENGFEYMWVEVSQWEGEGPEATLSGILINEPEDRRDLKCGQNVRVREREVFDWLRVTSLGRHVGHFTARALGLNTDGEPLTADGFFERAKAKYRSKEFEWAIADFRQALQIDEGHLPSMNGLAWILATCPDDLYRNGQAAVQYATEAVERTQWRDASYLTTLAAACAEVGDFAKAARWAQRGLELADDDCRRSSLERLLHTIRSGQAFHE